MLTEYIEAALAAAKYELIQDEEPYYGEVPGLEGVWATGRTLEECRQNLREVLEGWIVYGCGGGYRYQLWGSAVSKSRKGWKLGARLTPVSWLELDEGTAGARLRRSAPRKKAYLFISCPSAACLPSRAGESHSGVARYPTGCGSQLLGEIAPRVREDGRGGTTA